MADDTHVPTGTGTLNADPLNPGSLTTNPERATTTSPNARLDTSGLTCPLPVLKARKTLASMVPGQCLEIIATDPQSPQDMRVLCETKGHILVASEVIGPDVFRFLIARGH